MKKPPEVQALKAAEAAFRAAQLQVSEAAARLDDARDLRDQAGQARHAAAVAADLATLPHAWCVVTTQQRGTTRERHVIVRQGPRRMTTRKAGSGKDGACYWRWNDLGYWEPYPKHHNASRWTARLIIDLGAQTNDHNSAA